MGPAGGELRRIAQQAQPTMRAGRQPNALNCSAGAARDAVPQRAKWQPHTQIRRHPQSQEANKLVRLLDGVPVRIALVVPAANHIDGDPNLEYSLPEPKMKTNHSSAVLQQRAAHRTGMCEIQPHEQTSI